MRGSGRRVWCDGPGALWLHYDPRGDLGVMGQFHARVVQAAELGEVGADGGDVETLCDSVFGALDSPQHLRRAQALLALGETQSLFESSVQSICRWKTTRKSQ